MIKIRARFTGTTSEEALAEIKEPTPRKSLYVMLVPRVGDIIDYDGKSYEVTEARNQAVSKDGQYEPRYIVTLTEATV